MDVSSNIALPNLTLPPPASTGDSDMGNINSLMSSTVSPMAGPTIPSLDLDFIDMDINFSTSLSSPGSSVPGSPTIPAFPASPMLTGASLDDFHTTPSQPPSDDGLFDTLMSYVFS
jgi:hypothetical protein